MNGKFDMEIFAPRFINQLVSNSTCSLYGWGGASLIPRRFPVDVFKSTVSDDGKDIEGFISTFTMLRDPRCEAHLGSPVVCGYPNPSFCGIVTNKNRECIISSNGQFSLEYVHIGDYIDWIKEVSSGRTIQVSIVLLLTIMTTMLSSF